MIRFVVLRGDSSQDWEQHIRVSLNETRTETTEKTGGRTFRRYKIYVFKQQVENKFTGEKEKDNL